MGYFNMWFRIRIMLPLLIFVLLLNLFGCGHAKLIVKNFGNCAANVNYNAKFNTSIKTVNDIQYLDGVLILTAAMDNTIRSNVTVKMLNENKYVYLFSINDRKSCDSLHKYLGEFIYDLERQAQLIPRLCPIPIGRYRVYNAPLNVERITVLSTVPLGSLRLIDMVYDKDNKVYTCLMIDAENRIY